MCFAEILLNRGFHLPNDVFRPLSVEIRHAVRKQTKVQVRRKALSLEADHGKAELEN